MSPTTAIQRLYVLLCGYEVLPRCVSIRGGGDRFVVSVPISAYLLKTGHGPVLFDTGIDPWLVRDQTLRMQHFTQHGWEAPVVWPQHELIPQLEMVGVAPGDIRHVILSHAHFDHTGGVKSFPGATIWMQKAEHDYAFGATLHAGVVRSDLTGPTVDWRLIDGDREIMPGLTLLSTPGHTPGHQSAHVVLPNTGSVLLVGDVGDWMLNFDQEILPGEASDNKAALDSIRRINRIRRDENADMFVCHDPDLIQIQKLVPDFYD